MNVQLCVCMCVCDRGRGKEAENDHKPNIPQMFSLTILSKLNEGHDKVQ